MPFISFIKKKYSQIEVPEGSILMQSLLHNGRPVASSCLGKGICSKCRIEVVAGAENLNSESSLELTLRHHNNIDKKFRISCQTQVMGDITVDATYW